MLPTSERFYLIVIVGGCLLMAVISFALGIRTLSGDGPKPSPQYENAPPAAAIGPAPLDSIASEADARQPPFPDADYLVLHRESRLLLSNLGSQKSLATIKRLAANKRLGEQMVETIINEVAANADQLQIQAPEDFEIPPPLPDREGVPRTTVVATVQYLPRLGDSSSPLRVIYSLYWEKKQGEWRLSALVPRVSVVADSGSSELAPPPPQQEGGSGQP